MHIKRIISQCRRDMRVDYECEHCGNIEENSYAYDDAFYHNRVIPMRVCIKCNQVADSTYRPLTTKYPDNVQV